MPEMCLIRVVTKRCIKVSLQEFVFYIYWTAETGDRINNTTMGKVGFKCIWLNMNLKICYSYKLPGMFLASLFGNIFQYSFQNLFSFVNISKWTIVHVCLLRALNNVISYNFDVKELN